MRKRAKLTTRILPSAQASHDAMREILKWADSIDFAYAWMTSRRDGFDLWHALDETKIRHGVVGLNFSRTEPRVLRFFFENVSKKVRIIEDAQGTFHPKVLVAAKGNERRAILGSSNFTHEGFGENTELNVLLEGTAGDPAFQVLDDVILAQWLRADGLTRERLASYDLQYEAARRLPRPRRSGIHAGMSSSRRKSRGVMTAESLDLPWKEYAQLLQGRLEFWIDEEMCKEIEIPFLTEVEEIQGLLEGDDFEDLEIDDRRRVAGIKLGYGWLGASRSNRPFARLVRDEEHVIGRIVARIPLHGHYGLDARVEMTQRAFDEAERISGVGIATVTRLLSVKRPDWFITVNGGNRKRMKRAFDETPDDLDVDRYLALLQRIWGLPWWNPRSAPKGDSFQSRLWRARVALLDAFFYEKRKRPISTT